MKHVYIKVYNSGVLQRVFYDFTFSSFTEVLHGGLGFCSVVIPEKFDDFGYGTQVANDYELRIIVNRGGEDVTVYSGRIEEIEAGVTDKESVIIHCYGYTIELANNIHEDAGKVKFNYSSQELSDILRDILDKHAASLATAKVTYTASSLLDTSTNISFKTFASTVLEALQSVIQRAPSNWYSRVDADNVFHFREISATPDHYFVLGRDIGSLRIIDSYASRVSKYLFYNGLPNEDPQKIFKLYTDGTADRRFKIKRDDRVLDTTTADADGSRMITTFGSGLQTIDVRIIDNSLTPGYDIESINVGDTCKVINTDPDVPLPDNGVITSKTYNIDYVDLTIAETRQYIAKSLFDQKQRQDLSEFNDELPQSYTT